MLKMIIADDEQTILDGIKESIDWWSYDIHVIGAAQNGVIALEMAKDHRPDIIITDIRMPGLNGLELINELKKTRQDIKIIIISAYEQFVYAQEAISLGVLSFITKPLKKQKIIDEVIKARDLILEERRQKDTLDRLEDLYLSSLPTLQEYFHNKLIMGKTKLTGDYKKQFSAYGIDIDEVPTGVVIFALDNIEEKAADVFDKTNQMALLRIVEMIKQFFPQGLKRTVFQSYNNEVVAIYNTQTGSMETIQAISNAAETIKNTLKRETGISVSAGIGSIYPSVEDISLSYQEAVKALNYRLVYGKNTVLCINHMESKDIKAFPLNDFNNILTNIQNVLWTGKADEVIKIIGKMLDELTLYKNIPYYYIQQIFCQLLSALLRTLFEMSIQPEDIYGEPVHLYGELFKKQTLDELKQWYQDLVERTCAVINRKKSIRINSVIESAVSFIKKNCQKDISLSEVAEHVNLNPSYLSRLFKEETGIPFIEYVRNTKMELAKEFLRNTNKKIYEICEDLGYQNVQYFSTVFKNAVGMTPLEYKKSGR